MLILAMALSLTLSAAAYADGEKNDWRGIVWERDSLLEALFITGVGVLPVEQPMPWQVDAARTTAICFDSGVTDIPTGFTEGCVNMKTVMIPASVRSIGQGVLAISGGLKDVYYQGTLEGLLSIQMFPEDRAALNGARFHESKIIYDITGEPFDYVPVEKGQEGTMEIVDDGKTVTGTLSDGTSYTIYVNNEGDPDKAVIQTDTSDIEITYHYRADGTLESRTYRSTNRETGKTGTITEYYAADGRTKVSDLFLADDGSTLTNTYYEDGKTVKTKQLVSADSGKKTYTYRRDGTLETTVTESETAKLTTYFDEDGKVTKKVYTITDGNDTVTREFDASDKLTKETKSSSERTLVSEYNDQGDIVKQTLTDKNNNKITQVTNDDGSAVQTTEYAPGFGIKNSYTGEEMKKRTLYYNTEKKLKQQVAEYENGTIVTIEYSNGKPTVETEVFAPGTVDHQTGKGFVKNVTNLDENGQPVSATAYLDDNSYYTEAYDASSNLVHTEYSPEGKKTYEAVNANKGMGNKVNEKFFNEDGSWKQIDYDGGSTITRYFDKDGNETTETGSPIVP